MKSMTSRQKGIFFVGLIMLAMLIFLSYLQYIGYTGNSDSEIELHTEEMVMQQQKELRVNAEEITELTVELQKKEALLAETQQVVSEKNSTIQTLTSEREGLIWKLEKEGFEDK